MEHNQLVVDIESKFNLALAISMFFPILLATYFVVMGGAGQVNQNNANHAFVFFAIVGFYLGGYCFFQLMKSDKSQIPGWAFDTLNWLLFGGILCFFAPILFLVIATTNAPITWTLLFDAKIFQVSLAGTGILAFGVFSFCIFSLIGLDIIVPFWKWCKNRSRRK